MSVSNSEWRLTRSVWSAPFRRLKILSYLPRRVSSDPSGPKTANSTALGSGTSRVPLIRIAGVRNSV